jgi:hypothetical protein
VHGILDTVTAEIVVLLIAGYGAIGLLFSAAFVSLGIGRIDPAARTGGWGFRLLALPGSIALWPLLAMRWMRRQEPPDERGPHRGRDR